MNQVTKSLAEITTGYSIFEKDQVLSHEQLNSISNYFDDQTRLTRIKLLGVGIVCGLRIVLRSGNISLTKGAGVTTDGDLLYAADSVFDKFKLYDESNPVYGPFYVDNKIIKLFELVRQDTTDPQATALRSFDATTGSSLNDMVAVLFVEGYVKDEDLCSGTDCDNLGKDFVNTMKILLVGKSSVDLLRTSITTPNQAAGALDEIVADRPLFASGIASPEQLTTVYRTVCNIIHGKLVAELSKLYAKCSAFLGDVFASDPTPGWVAKLNSYKTFFDVHGSGIQYYYDFLKDLVETYNHFRELLFGDTTWCWPETEAFPKHLLLGDVVPGTDLDANRIGFYPSPLTSQTAGRLNHAQFLAGKLNTLIQTFQVPSSSSPIRVTPSRFEDDSLEERAIPYYYQVNTTDPVQKNWNYHLSKRGMDAFNYSYSASAYGAQGGAANPFGAQIGRFSFFRIEGHIGKSVAESIKIIEGEIASKNLPFKVHSVLLGTDKTQIVKQPGTRYSDLHRFHYLLRQDAFHQLDSVVKFSGTFKGKVDDAVTAGVVTNSPADNDGAPVKDIAAEKHATVTTKAKEAGTKLNRPYSQFKGDSSWKTDLNDAMKASGEFKYNLGKVVKTEFTTPFDSLISNTQILWLDWLDDIIEAKDEKEDDKLLFSEFLSQHPGIEHFAGVARGGTFVLAYDAGKNVVADFMLPYYYCEAAEQEPEEPPLPKPGLKPDWIIDNGININPSREKFVNGKLDALMKNTIDPKIDVQKDNFEFFKQSMKTVADVFGGASSGGTRTNGTRLTDDFLDASVVGAKTEQRKLQLLRQRAADRNLPEETRKNLETQARESEAALARSVLDTAKYISDGGISVAKGSEGFKAITEVSSSIGTLTDAKVKTSLKEGLSDLIRTTQNEELRKMLESMSNF
ncbi:MAG TPA: hypothetical protein VIS96_12350 [Terrimicrobiaceae bacterium]